jgi:hypothetical protein
MKMSRGSLAWIVAWVVQGAAVATAADLVLVANGKPLASIVLASQPTRAAQLAAFELQEHVRLITDAVLPIVRDVKAAKGIRIFVGASPGVAAPDDLADQEYAVLFRPRTIVLIGRDTEDHGEVRYWVPDIPGGYDYLTWPGMFDEKGTLHATYEFLERLCGIRWFDQSEFGTDAPRAKTLRVSPQDLRKKPAFRYRDAGYSPVTMDRYDNECSLWTVRWNESTPRFQEWMDLIYERGRKLPVCAHPHRWLDYQRGRVFAFLTRRKLGGEPFKTNHSFYGWYDRFWEKNPAHAEAFVERRPAWFAEGYPGEKVPPQLCYSNPDVLAQCVADARTFFSLSRESQRGSSLGTERFFPVVPMDNTSFCKCARCEPFGPPERVHPEFSNGDHSGRVWAFVNDVARGLRSSHPDKMVSALAYSTYAWRPKDMKIEDNIAVQMALFPQAAATSREMLENDDAILHQWADGRPLYLWLYAGLTTGHKPTVPMFPQQMGRLYATLLQKYLSAHVRGVFFNGIPQETDAYFLFKLTEDPSQDVDALIDDYFRRMYGPEAGPILQEFHRTMEEIYANPRHHPQGVSGPELAYGVLGTATRMRQLERLVAEAEAALADAPEPWRKRFAMFKFGTWDYMREGRASYEKGRVVTSRESVGMSCPVAYGPVAGGRLDDVEWRDAQGFGGFPGWLKDNGDVSLRRIDARFIHDGRHLYLRLHEHGLDGKPAEGDAWEILLRHTAGQGVKKLFIGPSGSIRGQVVDAGGAPQEWAGHGATASSRASEAAWQVDVGLPLSPDLLDPSGRLFMNCRLQDAAGEDSPVLVATGNDFDAAKTGALVSFDKRLTASLHVPADRDLILDWHCDGDGPVVTDRSGHGNDGKLVGAVIRGEDGVTLTGGNQYLEVTSLKGLGAQGYTFTCWFKYPDANRQGHLLVSKQKGFEVRLGVPNRRLGFLNEAADGTTAGAGPSGVELAPSVWHMLTVSHDGTHIRIYENGRARESLPAERFQSLADADGEWFFGGSPKRPPHYTFLGTFSQLQMYGRPLSPEEVMAKYAEDAATYRR